MRIGWCTDVPPYVGGSLVNHIMLCTLQLSINGLNFSAPATMYFIILTRTLYFHRSLYILLILGNIIPWYLKK